MPDNSNPSGSPLTRKKYTPAFKAECVRQVAAGARQTDVARAQSLSPALLGRWQRQALAEAEAEAEAVPSSVEREEIKRLRAELKRVEQERDILKKSREYLLPTASFMSRYQFIEQLAATKPVQVLCRVLAVSGAGYYQWRSRPARLTPAWEPAASAAFSRHAQRYGTRRLRAELRAEGHAVGRHALRSCCVAAAGGRSVPGRNALAPPWLTPKRSWPKTCCLTSPRLRPPIRGGRHHLPAPGRRALVLSGHLARYLLAAGSWLAPGPADAHRTGAHGPGAGPNAAPASSGPDYPCRPRQPIHQFGVPGAHRKSPGTGQL